MRIARLALALAAGALLAPATAGATSFEGSCDFSSPAGLSAARYDLEGLGSCSGVLNGVEAGYEVVWQSRGSGAFGCGAGAFLAGRTELDFYAIDIDAPGQPRSYVDTLEVGDGLGVADPSGRVRRALAGLVSGTAVETGRLTGAACDDGRVYRGGFVTDGELVD